MRTIIDRCRVSYCKYNIYNWTLASSAGDRHASSAKNKAHKKASQGDAAAVRRNMKC